MHLTEDGSPVGRLWPLCAVLALMWCSQGMASACYASAGERAVETPTLETIRAAVRARDQSLQQLYLRYRERIKPSPAARKSGMLAKVITASEMAVAFKGQKRYRWFKYGTNLTIATYNGHVCKIWDPNTKNGVVQLAKSSLTEGSSYFACIFLPISDADKLRVRRGEPTLSLLDVLAQDGWRLDARREAVGGRPCVLLQRNGRDRIWMDPGRNFAVLKRQFVLGGPNQKQFLCTHVMGDLVQVTPRAWLPKHMRNRKAAVDDPSVYYVQTFDVLEISGQVDDSLFESVKFPPGTDLIDGIAGVSYTVPAPDERPFERSIALALLSRRRYGTARAHWLLALNASVLGLLAVYLALYAFRRHAQRQPTRGRRR